MGPESLNIGYLDPLEIAAETVVAQNAELTFVDRRLLNDTDGILFEEVDLRWGLKYVNDAYFGPFGPPG